MPTSITSDYHFMAKVAKNRMIKEGKSLSAYKNRSFPASDVEFYYSVVQIIRSEQKVYNPISILIGKDLELIPNSDEKQRAVLQVINKYTEVRDVLRKELLLAIRENRKFEIKDLSIDPLDLLSKL